MVSGVAISIIWGWMFNGEYGIINYLLSLLGIDGPDWLVDPAWALLRGDSGKRLRRGDDDADILHEY